MLQKFLIWVVVFVIILFLISRCDSEAPEPTVTIKEATEGAEDLSGSATDAAGKALDATSDAAETAGSTLGKVADSAKDAAGNALDSASDAAGTAGSAVSDMTDSAKDVAGDAVGTAGSAVGEVADSAKDAAGNALDSAGNAIGAAGSAVGGMAGSAKDEAGQAVDSAGNVIEDTGSSIKSDDPSEPLTPHRSINAPKGISEIPTESGSNLVLEGVTFKFNSVEIESDSYVTLNALADKLKSMNNQVEIAGYTDNIGPDNNNLKASQLRAEAVVKYLTERGVDAGRLTAKGYGSASPVADNNTRRGRQANRRVELKVK